MANVYIEPRPKGRAEGSPIDDFVVEDGADHVLKTFSTQKEAIDWAKKEGHHPLGRPRPASQQQENARPVAGGVAATTGLVPAIHVSFNAAMKAGWFYLMTNRRNGILYAGVTSNLPRRAFEHRQGLIRGFTKRYGLKTLVYCEQYDDIRLAISASEQSSTGRALGKFA